MSAQCGKDLLLKVEDGNGQFMTIGGMRTQRLALNATSVDITHAQSVGQWRELLAGAGLRHASLAGSGIFKDSTTDLKMKTIFFDGSLVNWQIVLPSFGILQGLFQITSLDYRGEYSGGMTFDLALESAGALTFSPIIS